METAEATTTTKWSIDSSHSEISFRIKHLTIANVKGVFRDFKASINIEDGKFMTSDIDFSMNPASIDTNDEKRDAHLKGQEFFDVDKYKQITFKGTKYKKTGNDSSYELYGDLTIKGISKQVKLDVEFGGVKKDPWGKEKAGYQINGKIHRKDWGLTWNANLEEGGFLLSDEVKISCEIELIKQS
ncbi:MAG: YceI family protein [Bacteroidia bacterium]